MNLQSSQEFSRNVVAAMRRARLAKGISQGKLAALSGLSRSAITMTEAGDRNPTLLFLHALAKAMGAELSDFIVEAEARERGPSGT